jgi:hypothetical protein
MTHGMQNYGISKPVLTNNNTGSSGSGSSVYKQNEFQPFLGNTWYHCISIRITLEYLDDNSNLKSNFFENVNEEFPEKNNTKEIFDKRILTISKSPYLPSKQIIYSIKDFGLNLIQNLC